MADVVRVAARLREQRALDAAIFHGVVVAVDENVDALHIFEHIIRAIARVEILAAHVADCHDEVTALALQPVHLALDGLVELLAAEKLEPRDCHWRCARRGLGRRDADYTDFVIALLNDGGRLREKLARRLDDNVARENGELRLAHALLRHVLTVIELMIAEAHRVVAHGVHELNGRRALAEIHEIIVLYRVARVEQQHILAVGNELVAQSRDRRHAVHAAFVRALIVAVRVIRVQNDEVREIMLHRGRRAAARHDPEHEIERKAKTH